MDPDFESMSVEELVEWKLNKKLEILELKAEMRTAETILSAKLERQRAIDALVNAGIDPVILGPEPARIGMKGGQVG